MSTCIHKQFFLWDTFVLSWGEVYFALGCWVLLYLRRGGFGWWKGFFYCLRGCVRRYEWC